MAGTSKSYLRKTHAQQIAGTYTTTHPDYPGKTMTVVPQFTYNPGDYPVVDATTGRCISRANSDEEFFAQSSDDNGVPGGGPEKGFGGAQVSPSGVAITKSAP